MQFLNNKKKKKTLKLTLKKLLACLACKMLNSIQIFWTLKYKNFSVILEKKICKFTNYFQFDKIYKNLICKIGENLENLN